MDNLQQLLQRAVSGEEYAVQQILQAYKENVYTQAEQEQIQLYLKHAARGSHYAIYLQALFYAFGYSVKSDDGMAFLLMREAAAKGNSRAIYFVGYYYLKGIGVTQHLENAKQWLTIAAGSPHYVPEAMYELGQLYEKGLGVTANSEKAHQLYADAARKGHQEAKQKINS